MMAGLTGTTSFCSSRNLKQGTPTDDVLEELDVDIEENWRQLGRRLRVGHAKLEEMDRRHVQMSEKGYHMLKHWSQKNGSRATYQALCDGLLNKLVQRRDLAEKFCYINDSKLSQEASATVVLEEMSVNSEGSSIRKKRKAPSSSCGYQDNLKKAKLESSQHTSKPALDQDSKLSQGASATMVPEEMSVNSEAKNKSEEEQEGTYTVYGDTVKVTSTINDDINYINVTYIQNDSEVQQSRKPIRIGSYSLKKQNDEKVYSVVVTKHTRYEDVMEYKFYYKDVYYCVTYILNDCEVRQSRTPKRFSGCTLKMQNNKRTKSENVMDYKFDYKDMDYDNVIKIVDIKDVSDYSLVIVIGKSTISTSPVDIINDDDIQIDEKEFKKLEAEIGDDTSSFTITIWEDQTSPVHIQLGKKELFKKIEAEIGDDTYSITITLWEDQVKKFKNQPTYIMNIQGTKCLSLNSDSKIVQDNSSSATVEVTSISCVGEINRFFRCKKCSEKLMPCQGNVLQCTVCRMKQLNDSKDTNILVILYLSEPDLLLTIFQDQLDNIVKIYNEENNENKRLLTLTDITLTKIILSVSNVKIHYDKNTKIITDIQKM